MSVRLAALAVMFLALTNTAARSDASPLDPKAVIERSEAAIGNRLGPHVLTDSHGDPPACRLGRPGRLRRR